MSSMMVMTPVPPPISRHYGLKPESLGTVDELDRNSPKLEALSHVFQHRKVLGDDWYNRLTAGLGKGFEKSMYG